MFCGYTSTPWGAFSPSKYIVCRVSNLATCSASLSRLSLDMLDLEVGVRARVSYSSKVLQWMMWRLSTLMRSLLRSCGSCTTLSMVDPVCLELISSKFCLPQENMQRRVKRQKVSLCVMYRVLSLCGLCFILISLFSW